MSNNPHENHEQPQVRFDYVSGLGINRLFDTKLKGFQRELSPLVQPESKFSIRRATDVSGFLKETAQRDPEITEAIKKLDTAIVVEVTGETGDNPETHHDRAILLLGDTEGRQASITVALYGTALGITPEPGEEFNPLIHNGHFGGMGVYGQKYEGLPPVVDALTHAEELSKTMYAKAQSCGFEFLAGSKAVITNLQNADGETEAWLDSPVMQYTTGMIFSKVGPRPFNGIITGSDAKQTQDTIDRMGRGSRLADERSYNIVGTRMYGFTGTAGFVEHSMRGSYIALQEAAPEYLPNLDEAAIAVQGLGKIGSTTLEMYLKAGGKRAYVADMLLDKEQTGDTLKARARLETHLTELRQKYADSKIFVTASQDIWDQQVDIVAPCSTQEKVIDQSVIDRMAVNGVKVVLAGANNPLENPDVADYALQQHGIAILPEVVSNNGSAITAGMEPRLLHEMSTNKYSTIEECMRAVLIPRITQTAKSNVDRILQEYAKANHDRTRNDRISLYRIGQRIFS